MDILRTHFVSPLIYAFSLFLHGCSCIFIVLHGFTCIFMLLTWFYMHRHSLFIVLHIFSWFWHGFACIFIVFARVYMYFHGFAWFHMPPAPAPSARPDNALVAATQFSGGIVHIPDESRVRRLDRDRTNLDRSDRHAHATLAVVLAHATAAVTLGEPGRSS